MRGAEPAPPLSGDPRRVNAGFRNSRGELQHGMDLRARCRKISHSPRHHVKGFLQPTRGWEV